MVLQVIVGPEIKNQMGKYTNSFW